MTQLNAFAMTGTAKDFGGSQRIQKCQRLGEGTKGPNDCSCKWQGDRHAQETSTLESSGQSMLSQSTNDPAVLESETSADELTLEVSANANHPHKRLKRVPEKHHSRSDPKRHSKKSSSRADRPGRARAPQGMDSFTYRFWPIISFSDQLECKRVPHNHFGDDVSIRRQQEQPAPPHRATPPTPPETVGK
jgi:hypothetical protein